MATLNFPDAPDTGDTYTDSNSGFTYEWNGTVWISKDPSTASNIRELDNISGSFNGSTTAFTLQVAGVNVEPANVQQLIISVGGVMQNAGDDYTVSGSTLTFTTAPTSGLTFFGTLLGTALSLNTVADGSVSPSSLTTTSTYIVGGLTADQNAGIVTSYGLVAGVGGVNVSGAGIVTSYGLVAGAGGVNVSGAVTGGSFSGDGSGLTGVASTDNIITSYGATFLSNVRVAGIFTAANAYVTGILTAQTLNYNNVTDIYSTGIITATGGIQQTGNEGLHVSAGISTVGIFTATKATVGLAVTINNTGVDAGIGAGIITAKDYYGNASNMTGIGITADIIAASPLKSSETYSAIAPFDPISFNVNQGIKAGNAAKEIELRHNSLTGNIVQSFGVGSSVTYSFGQAFIQPAVGAGITNEETYFVKVPDGAFEAVGGGNSTGIVNDYSFAAKPYTYSRFVWGDNYGGYTFGDNGEGDYTNGMDASSPVLVGSGVGAQWTTLKASGTGNVYLGRKTDGTLWVWGQGSGGQTGQNSQQSFSSPKQIGTDTNWSRNFTCETNAGAIKTDGTLWMWGANEFGQCAQNDMGGAPQYQTYRSSPTQVGTDTNWKYISQGQGQHCCTVATKTDGTIWFWGRSTVGADGQNGSQWQPNSPGPNGIFRSSPTQIGTETDWFSARCVATGSVYASKAVTDEPGRFGDKKGELWVWGNNSTGCLGNNSQSNLSSPAQLPGQQYDMMDPMLSGGHQVMGHTKYNGYLYVWGDNTYGTLGQNNRTNYSSPKLVGTDTDWKTWLGANKAGFQLKDDDSLWVMGRNYNGMMGQDGDANNAHLSSPVQIDTTAKWVTLSGSYYTIMGANRAPA